MQGLDALENIRREAGVPYFSTLYDIDMWKEDFKIVQEYLEVLNILDYRAVNIELFKEVMYDYKNNDEKALYVYNYCEHEYRKLTIEEFLKIKKFLLTNYKERVEAVKCS